MDAPLIPDAAPLGVQWITCPQFRDERGVLSVAEHNELPFVPQRTFWITSVPPEAQRGGHAHRTTHELLGALHGSCKLELQNSLAENCSHLGFLFAIHSHSCNGLGTSL